MTLILNGVGSHVYGEPTQVADAYSNAGASYRPIANGTSSDAKVAPIVAGIHKVLVHSPTILFGSNASSGHYNTTPCALESGKVANVYPVLYFGASCKIADGDLIPPIAHNDGQSGAFVAMTVEFNAGTAQTGVLMVAAGSPYGAYMGMNTFSYYSHPVDGNITLQAIAYGVAQATYVAPPYLLYIGIGAGAIIIIAIIAYLLKKK
jgi:hypothetical protein